MVWVREINVRGPQGPGGTITDESIREEGVLVGLPTGSVGSSGRQSLPIAWTGRELLDPMSDVVSDELAGTWETGLRFGKEVPLLSPAGKIYLAQIPDQVAMKTDIPAPPVVDTTLPLERPVTLDLPIFGARVAAARLASAPVAFVFTGSSTLAASPGVVGPVTPLLQACYPVESPTTAQWSTSAEFTEHTSAGLHVYSAAQGSTDSSDYLTDAECDRIASLKPAVIVHMLPNDYSHQTDPAVFASNVTARIEYFDSVLTEQCQHVLVHPYQRQDWTPPTYTWDEYEDALRTVADSRLDVVMFTLNPSYVANGIPGPDPLGLISSDTIHQTPAGYAFMAMLFAALFLA